MSELEYFENVESHEEKIICPNCGSVETAVVKHTSPWWMYAHICSKCEYQITESEWQQQEQTEINMYNKFLVVKWDWLKENLNECEYDILNHLLEKATLYKPNHQYYVVNLDEPYADKVKDIIVQGEKEKCQKN